MYLLDTNHCSKIIAKHPQLIRKLEELGDIKVSTCVIVRGELIFMAFRSKYKKENLENIINFVNKITVYQVDNEVADVYGEMKSAIYQRFGPKEKAKREKVKLEKLGISENDLWIAAIAKRFGLTIVSADSDFQRLQAAVDIQAETWWTPDPQKSGR